MLMLLIYILLSSFYSHPNLWIKLNLWAFNIYGVYRTLHLIRILRNFSNCIWYVKRLTYKSITITITIKIPCCLDHSVICIFMNENYDFNFIYSRVWQFAFIDFSIILAYWQECDLLSPTPRICVYILIIEQTKIIPKHWESGSKFLEIDQRFCLKKIVVFAIIIKCKIPLGYKLLYRLMMANVGYHFCCFVDQMSDLKWISDVWERKQEVNRKQDRV